MASRRRVIFIGFFVMAGCCLAILMLLIFGGAKLFSRQLSYRMYFDQSVKGLSVGSPVMFRGVRVGQVSRVRLAFRKPTNESMDSWPIEVTVKLLPEALGISDSWQNYFVSIVKPASEDRSMSPDDFVSHLVKEQGLRVQLQSLSLLTGQLCVELNFIADSPLSMEMERDLLQGILPVEVTTMEMLKQTFSKKDFTNRLDVLRLAMHQVGDFVKAGKLQKLLDDLSIAATNANSTFSNGMQETGPMLRQFGRILVLLESNLKKADANIAPLLEAAKAGLETVVSQTDRVSNEVTDLAQSTKGLVHRFDHMVAENEQNIGEIGKNLRESSENITVLIGELQTLTAQLNVATAPGSELQAELKNTLAEFERAALSLRSLAEFLRRNPDALIRGKGKP